MAIYYILFSDIQRKTYPNADMQASCFPFSIKPKRFSEFINDFVEKDNGCYWRGLVSTEATHTYDCTHLA